MEDTIQHVTKTCDMDWTQLARKQGNQGFEMLIVGGNIFLRTFMIVFPCVLKD